MPSFILEHFQLKLMVTFLELRIDTFDLLWTSNKTSSKTKEQILEKDVTDGRMGRRIKRVNS